MNAIMNLLISPANAQAAGFSLGGFDVMSILPLVLIFVVFYLFLIRPQQKKAQQQRELLTSLTRGDRVLTVGGIIGVITKVINDQELQIEIADDVKVRVARAMVADRISKTEPVSDSHEEKTPRVEKKAKPTQSLKKSPSIKKNTKK